MRNGEPRLTRSPTGVQEYLLVTLPSMWILKLMGSMFLRAEVEGRVAEKNLEVRLRKDGVLKEKLSCALQVSKLHMQTSV